MLIKCMHNTGKDLPTDCLVPNSGFGVDADYQIVKNKNYVVYGMTLFSGYIWYFLFTESETYYPISYPSPLFKVVDGRLSKYWLYSFENAEKRESLRYIWAFPEWANDPYYYDRLTDGEIDDIKIFQMYKHLMDVEFPNPDVLEKAKILDDEWLLCPNCIDGWKSNTLDGMVICPQCKTIMHNPRYES